MRQLMIATSMTMAALTGCAMEPIASVTRVDAPRDADVVSDEAYRPILGAVGGRIAGDIGPMSDLDHQATQQSAYDDGYYISIETVVEMQDRAVMTLLSVSKGADLFVPGTSATFPLDGDDETRVTVLGCVGQDVDVYDEWDKPADEVDIDVSAPDQEEFPGELDVDVVARWYDRDELGTKLDTFRTGSTTLTLTR